MKKVLALLLACSSLSSTFAADAPSLKIGGKFEFGGIYREQPDAPKDKKKMSSHLDNSALFSNAAITANISNENDDGLKYGAVLGVQPLHARSRPNPSYMYIETTVGKIEIGSGKTVMSQMAIGGWDLGRGLGSAWSTHVNLDPESLGASYMDDFSSYLDFSYRQKEYVDFSRKISYVSPKVYGLQIGLSYIPDTANSGGAGYSKDHKHFRAPGIDQVYLVRKEVSATDATAEVKKKLEESQKLDKIKEKDINRIDLTHGFSGAVSYEYEVNEDVKVNLAVVGEYGKAKNPEFDPEAAADSKTILPSDKKKADLKYYIIGGKVTYKQFSIAGSYGNSGDSLASEWMDGQDLDARKKSGWDVGLGYSEGNIGTSINYFHSNAMKNELDAFAVGADYTLAPGLTPYVQAVKYNANGKYKDPKVLTDAPILEDKKGSGYMFIIGTRLKF